LYPIEEDPMISFEACDVHKRFEGVVALRSAGMSFEGPKICGLVGANGSGKTTFARVCCGLVRKDCGTVLIDGNQVEIDTPYDAGEYGIVLAHQNLSLIPDLSVWENIKLGHEKTKSGFFLDNEKAKQEARDILNELVPGEIALETVADELSPAHKQMVEIAKALSQKPRLLILDEPTAALEYFHVEQLFKKVEQLKRDDVSIIFISHRLWEITRICDLVFVFRNGEHVGTVDFETAPRDDSLIIPLITGEEKHKTLDFGRKPKQDFTQVPVALGLEKISDGGKLKDVSLKAFRGEVLGIGGLNGQGQEELIMLIAGATKAVSGAMQVSGRTVRPRHPRDSMRRGIYLVPGDRMVDGLFPTHTVFENIIFPRLPLRQEGFRLNFKRLNSLADEIINRIDLVPPRRNMQVTNLSGGNQQKVVFGRWLQFKPTILLLNDPAKGIDIQAKDSLFKLTRELARNGTTVILYSSSNEELIANCDRVLIMFEGSIVEEFNYDQISDDNLVKSSLRVGETNGT
jgi:ribose transport system ATP-binding protein